MRIFISRELQDDSPVRTFAQNGQHFLQAESLVAFEPVAIGDLPDSDWIFFYSRRGVQFFVQQLRAAGIPFPEKRKLAVMGDGTAKQLKKQGRSPDFAGNGNPDTVAAAFGDLAQQQRVLFPRAVNSRMSIQELIRHKVDVIDLKVYNNLPREDFDLQFPFDVFLFTSPMNVEAFFRRYPDVDPAQRFVGIGKPTCESLRAQGVKVIQAPMASEKGLLAVMQG